eukprot:scaffold16886_cov101-Isochrysis_galbana.AAC.3
MPADRRKNSASSRLPPARRRGGAHADHRPQHGAWRQSCASDEPTNSLAPYALRAQQHHYTRTQLRAKAPPAPIPSAARSRSHSRANG